MTTTASATTATAADVVSTTDERLARLSARQRLLVRPGVRRARRRRRGLAAVRLAGRQRRG
ncbi:MAG: hypothetical protein WKF58_06305 [Ilumatobacteraceae bacterium]